MKGDDRSQDPQTVYGLAFGDKATMEPAQKHFQSVLKMEAPEDLRGLARNGLLWRIAARELKARGPRMDGGLLSGWALRHFRGMSLRPSI